MTVSSLLLNFRQLSALIKHHYELAVSRFLSFSWMGDLMWENQEFCIAKEEKPPRPPPLFFVFGFVCLFVSCQYTGLILTLSMATNYCSQSHPMHSVLIVNMFFGLCVRRLFDLSQLRNE